LPCSLWPYCRSTLAVVLARRADAAAKLAPQQNVADEKPTLPPNQLRVAPPGKLRPSRAVVARELCSKWPAAAESSRVRVMGRVANALPPVPLPHRRSSRFQSPTRIWFMSPDCRCGRSWLPTCGPVQRRSSSATELSSPPHRFPSGNSIASGGPDSFRKPAL